MSYPCTCIALSKEDDDPRLSSLMIHDLAIRSVASQTQTLLYQSVIMTSWPSANLPQSHPNHTYQTHTKVLILFPAWPLVTNSIYYPWPSCLTLHLLSADFEARVQPLLLQPSQINYSVDCLMVKRSCPSKIPSTCTTMLHISIGSMASILIKGQLWMLCNYVIFLSFSLP